MTRLVYIIDIGLCPPIMDIWGLVTIAVINISCTSYVNVVADRE